MKKILDKKIKRRDFVKAASIGMLGMATGGFPSISRAVEKYRFKFASHEPAHSFYTKAYWLWWCDRVEELSGSAVKFDRFPGGTLIKQGDIYEAVRDGVIQAGPFMILDEAGQIPLPTIKDLPFSFVNFDTSLSMWRKLMEAGLSDYLHGYGIQIVSDSTVTGFSFFATKKWGPLRRLEDFQGCKLRAPGGYMLKAVEAMGAKAISMTGAEVYTAMERGTIDACSMPEGAAVAWRIQEVTKFVTRVNYCTPGLPIMFSFKTWQTLPKDIQNIMLQAGRDAEVNLIKEVIKYEKEVIDPTFLKSGIETIVPSEQEKERMKKACAPVWDEWLAKNGPISNGLGKKMFDMVVQIVGKP